MRSTLYSASVKKYPVDFASLDFHWAMLRNRRKYIKFAAAMTGAVRGAEVLEVGTGTGVLALLATRLGAKRVWAIERPPIAGLTRKLLSQYFPAEYANITVIERDIFEVQPQSRECTALMSETVGYLGFEENIFSIFSIMLQWTGQDRQVLRWPKVLQMGCKPVSLRRWCSSPYLCTCQGVVDTQWSLGDPIELGVRVQPAARPPLQFSWTCREEKSFDGLAFAVSAEVAKGVMVGSMVSEVWPHCVVPLPVQVEASAGDTFKVDLVLRPCVDQFQVELMMSQSRDGKQLLAFQKTFRSSEIQASPQPRRTTDLSTLASYILDLLSECEITANCWPKGRREIEYAAHQY